jgi:hypothetical protein
VDVRLGSADLKTMVRDVILQHMDSANSMGVTLMAAIDDRIPDVLLIDKVG